MTKKPTIRDVAREAGVSVATVSRILNEKPDVSEETRAKVLGTIDRLGYARNMQWRQLTTGKSRVISLHYPNRQVSVNQVSLDFITGATTACEEHDYSLHLVTQSLNEKSILDLYRTNKCDGMILMEIELEDWRVELLREQQLPFVTIGHCENSKNNVSFIDYDIESAVMVVINHLVALGHHNIGLVSIVPAPDFKQYGHTVRAFRGYQKICNELQIPQFHCETDYQLSNVKQAARDLLSRNPQITAVLCVADMAVPGIFGAIQDLDLTIPDDISVVGLTNKQGSDLTNPPFTALDFPARTMGYEAGRMLIERLEGTLQGIKQILIKPTLTVRASTGPARPRVQEKA
jgi:DNA-binding LacI/PurR family transcriptional regulator